MGYAFYSESEKAAAIAGLKSELTKWNNNWKMYDQQVRAYKQRLVYMRSANTEIASAQNVVNSAQISYNNCSEGERVKPVNENFTHILEDFDLIKSNLSNACTFTEEAQKEAEQSRNNADIRRNNISSNLSMAQRAEVADADGE